VFLEQNAGKLPGRIKVQVGTGDAGDVLLQPSQVLPQLLAQLPEEREINSDPFPLHVCQHLEERHLDFAEQRLQVHFSQHWCEEAVQREDCSAVHSAVVRGLRDRHLSERDLRLSLTGHVLIGLERTSEMLETERVDGMRAAAGIQHEARKHGIVGHTGELDAGSPENLPVELDIVTRFRHRRIGE
jgi:hypothetical protein